jgi:hypothetical protein
MPSKDSEEKVVKNIDVKEKNKSKDLEDLKEESDPIDDDEIDNDDDEDDDDDDEDYEEDDDEEEDDMPDGLTDIGLYNVLGNFLVDDDGNTIGTSLSNIAKELAKLNHSLKKFNSKN